MLYRAGQFWNVLRTPSLTEGDLALCQSVLSDQQMALFTRLQPSEQAHGLRVMQSLQNQGEDHPDLLAAALLHDVGKIYCPLRPWERVVIVLGKWLFPGRAMCWGCQEPQGWKRPFVVARKHPHWGAEIARQAGASSLTVQLIQEHQRELHPDGSNTLSDRLLTSLQKADNQN